ncbi:hypothetical protein BH10BAC5_BH10BAC5_09450 [soil metagenome]
MATHEDNIHTVPVFNSGNEAIIALAKSMLDEANIRYNVKGEGVENLIGLGVIGTGFNSATGEIIIEVLETDEQQAKLLLKGLDTN